MAIWTTQWANSMLVLLAGMGQTEPEAFFLWKKGWEVVVPKANYIDWEFVRAYNDTYKANINWTEVDKYVFKMVLRQEDWSDIIFSATCNGATIPFINSIASAESLGKIYIKSYLKERNGKTYKSLFVLNDWEKMDWKRDMNEVNSWKTLIKDPDTWEVVKAKYDKIEKRMAAVIDKTVSKNFNEGGETKDVADEIMEMEKKQQADTQQITESEQDFSEFLDEKEAAAKASKAPAPATTPAPTAKSVADDATAVQNMPPEEAPATTPVETAPAKTETPITEQIKAKQETVEVYPREKDM